MISCGIISAALAGICPLAWNLVQEYCADHDLPFLAMIAITGGIISAAHLVFLLTSGDTVPQFRNHWGWISFRGFAGLLCWICCQLSARLGVPYGEVAACQGLSLVAVISVVSIYRGVHVCGLQWVSIALGSIGIILTLMPRDSLKPAGSLPDQPHWTGYPLSILSGCMGSFCFLAARAVVDVDAAIVSLSPCLQTTFFCGFMHSTGLVDPPFRRMLASPAQALKCLVSTALIIFIATSSVSIATRCMRPIGHYAVQSMFVTMYIVSCYVVQLAQPPYTIDFQALLGGISMIMAILCTAPAYRQLEALRESSTLPKSETNSGTTANGVDATSAIPNIGDVSSTNSSVNQLTVTSGCVLEPPVSSMIEGSLVVAATGVDLEFLSL